jgi:hypothetical protein
MMTGRCHAPPSRTRCLARLGGDDDHRMHACICSPRRTKVSTMMSTVMSAPAGESILPWRFCAPVATGALCLGGRHKDGEGEGKAYPHQEEGHTSHSAHNLPFCIR